MCKRTLAFSDLTSVADKSIDTIHLKFSNVAALQHWPHGTVSLKKNGMCLPYVCTHYIDFKSDYSFTDLIPKEYLEDEE